MQETKETWAGSLSQEVLLEKEIATHSSIIAGKSHGQSSLVSYSPWGCKESDGTELLSTSVSREVSRLITKYKIY